MAREAHLFEADGGELTDERLRSWGNVPIHVTLESGEEETVLAFDVTETPTGSIMIQALIELDGDHPQLFTIATYAGGRWRKHTKGGVIYDLEAILTAEEKGRQGAAAETLGVRNGKGPRPLRPA